MVRTTPQGKRQRQRSWAWKPDATTERAIKRGNRKVSRAKRLAYQRSMEANTMATRKAKGKAATKSTATKAAAKKATAKKSNVISLKELLRKSDMDPKIARRKLRKDSGMNKVHATKGRWDFTNAQATKARKVLGL